MESVYIVLKYLEYVAFKRYLIFMDNSIRGMCTYVVVRMMPYLFIVSSTNVVIVCLGVIIIIICLCIKIQFWWKPST